MKPLNQPHPGEISMKDFATREMEAHGISRPAVSMRLKRGHYPGLKIRRVNKRVLFCTMEGQTQ